MRKELRFDRRLNSAGLIRQFQSLKKEVTTLKKRQEQIINSIEGQDLTKETKRALKEARSTSIEKYVPHKDVKK